jgi:glycine/D-amino acid oxidase-like deaminating enzyme
MSVSNGTPFDFAVVGGGIAGLAIAELLQRSGVSVGLFEKNQTLCGEASAEQQGWFHTGALYAALPENFFCRTMVGNLDDLVDYYSGFPNMNLRIDKHISSISQHGWFSNRTNFYAYTALRGVRWHWKIPWAIALYRAKRRMSWFETLDASRSLSHQLGFGGSKPLRSVQHNSPLGVELDDVAFVLKSRDRAMDTTLIAEDLLRSFLATGGTLLNNTKVLSLERGRIEARRGQAGQPASYRARHIVLATGKESAAFDTRARVLISPLLVVAPALTDLNFVRMSPHMRDTINHVYHRHGDVDYSVMGNAIYYEAERGSEDLRQDVFRHMTQLARRVLGTFDDSRAELFFGSKTEVAGTRSMRNYLYKIIDRGDYTLALPGKFSLCFSLAANVCRHFGIEPVERLRLSSKDVSHLIARPLHLQLASRITGVDPAASLRAVLLSR